MACKLRIPGHSAEEISAARLQVLRPNTAAQFPGWVPQWCGSLGSAQHASHECVFAIRSQDASRWARGCYKEPFTMVHHCEASSHEVVRLQIWSWQLVCVNRRQDGNVG